MEGKDGGLFFRTGIDTSGLERDSKKAVRIIGEIGKKAEKEGEGVDKAFKLNTEQMKRDADAIQQKFSSVGKAIVGVFAVDKLKDFVVNVAQVRGEFQKMEAVLSNTLGSSSEAKKAMDMLTHFGATTPFQVDELTNSFIKLANQGFVPAEKEMTALGDFASAMGKSFDQLTEALIDAQVGEFERLKEFGVRASKEGDKVSFTFKGQTETVKMTSEAIREYLLSLGKMEGVAGANAKIAGTVVGKISNIEDAIKSMYNTIGKQNEGVINTSLDMVSSLIENWETIGKVLLTVISTYGAYKAAVIAVAAAHKLKAIWGSVEAFLSLTKAVKSAKDAMLLFNMATKANPLGLVLSVVAAVSSAFFLFKDRTDDATESVDGMKEAMKDLEEIEKSAADATTKESVKIEKLTSIVNDSTASYDMKRKALLKLQEIVPNFHASLNDELTLTKENTTAIADYIKQLGNKAKAEGYYQQMVEVNKRLAEAKRVQNSRQMAVDETQHELDTNPEYASRKERKRHGRSHMTEETNEKRREKNLELTSRSRALREATKETEKIQQELSLLESTMKKDDSVTKYFNDLILGDTSESEETIKKNREYWEGFKKEQQAALDALEDSELNSERAVQIRANIAKADERIKAYSVKSSSKNGGGTESDTLENMKRLGAELVELQQKNDAEEIAMLGEGTEKKVRAIQHDFEVRKAEIEKQAEEWKTENANNGNGNTLNPEQQAAIDKATSLNTDKRDNSLLEVLNVEREAMVNYLAEYGDFEQKKKNIREQFKVREENAETEGEKLALAKQLEEALSALDLENLKEKMDWSKIFGNLGEVSEGTLQTLKSQLIQFVNDSKGLSVQAKKEIVEALGSIDKELTDRTPFKTFGDSMNNLQDKTSALKDAQEVYNAALKEGTKEEIANAKAALDSARDEKIRAKAKATEALHSAAAKGHEYTEAAGSALGLVESFGLEPPEWIREFIGGFDKALSGLEKIDLMKPMTIVTGLMDTLSGMVTSIFSVGGLIDWKGSNAKEVADTINRLTDRNESLQTSIEDLTDEMRASRGMKSVGAYKMAHANQEEVNKNYLEMAEAQAGYHNNHHSWEAYWEGFTKSQMEWIRNNVKENFNGDLFSLTPEEMKKLRGNVEIWEAIRETGKGGYGERLTEKLDDYIDQAGKLEELTNQLYEGLTGISFDGMYSSFIDNLMNMKYSAEDAAKDISNYFMKAMLSNQIGELYADKLKLWWEKFGKAMENDGTLDELERSSLMDEYQGYVEEALKIRDELAKATGYDKLEGESQRQGSSKGFTAMSQDSADELNGRFTAMQLQLSDLSTQVAQSSVSLTTISDNTSKMVNSLSYIQGDTSALRASTEQMCSQIDMMTGIAESCMDFLSNISENSMHLKRLAKMEVSLDSMDKKLSRL